MEDFGAVLAVIAGLSLGVTKIVDTARNAFDRDDTLPKWTWNLAAFAVGIGFCVGWEKNITADLFHMVPALARDVDGLTGIGGYVISGLMVGGFAGFGHELLDRLSPKKVEASVSASVAVDE